MGDDVKGIRKWERKCGAVREWERKYGRLGSGEDMWG